jgi:hypothetical protein
VRAPPVLAGADREFGAGKRDAQAAALIKDRRPGIIAIDSVDDGELRPARPPVLLGIVDRERQAHVVSLNRAHARDRSSCSPNAIPPPAEL